ncbi:MAG: succinate dehydrogenase, hydrophobic membrane anchor protein [Paracoccaceae bacterium]
MAFQTDRKRAAGMGSAKTGTEHHWIMTVSASGLLVLVPLFIFTFGPALGKPYDEVLHIFSHPFQAIVAGLTLTVGFLHFRNGVQTVIEDYVHEPARKVLIVVAICFSYGAAATGLFAIARLAL